MSNSILINPAKREPIESIDIEIGQVYLVGDKREQVLFLVSTDDITIFLSGDNIGYPVDDDDSRLEQMIPPNLVKEILIQI